FVGAFSTIPVSTTWFDDPVAAVSSQSVSKSSDQTFYRRQFVFPKMCVTTGGLMTHFETQSVDPTTFPEKV
ncbi:MAG TPA: hypothetical protein VH107_09245, partial [Lacipirellulaceae bacterium]|nr:hypothetical protein [Lacipirellulaceae bacterium]